MSKVLVTESNLEDIADAIRNKNGTQNTYTPNQMATAIANIPTSGGNLQTKSVTITEDGNTTVSPDTGYDGLSSVTITTNVSGNIDIALDTINGEVVA